LVFLGTGSVPNLKLNGLTRDGMMEDLPVRPNRRRLKRVKLEIHDSVQKRGFANITVAYEDDSNEIASFHRLIGMLGKSLPTQANSTG
jgi:hypothetical protein